MFRLSIWIPFLAGPSDPQIQAKEDPEDRPCPPSRVEIYSLSNWYKLSVRSIHAMDVNGKLVAHTVEGGDCGKTNGAALRRTNTIRITPGRSLEGLSPGNSTSNWESEMKRLESYLFRTFLLAALSAPGFGQALKVEPIANPSGATSLQAHWGTAQDGSPLLSWVETLKDGSHTLRYAIRRGAQWSESRMIATNRHFFRQPAESPSVISFADGSLLAEWVEIPPGASEAEYIYVSASKDGVKWTSPVMAHQDRSPVQHALVSMVASGDREASLVWLEALKGEDAPSALRRTVVNNDGKVVKEESLDSDVCTCCPTSIVKTSRGLLVAYRDHTPQDIRDIAVIRFENGRWLPSKILNPDKWEINACPVNGASAVAKDNRVAIAWYTIPVQGLSPSECASPVRQ